MANLTATPDWTPVRQLEPNELATGGPNGNMNDQAKALLNRTEYLNQQKVDKEDIIQGQYSFATLAEFNAVKATIPVNSTVIIDEAGAKQGTNTWNGTTLTKSAYDPLTQAKNYVGNTGYASIVGVAVANINYTTSDRKLTFANTIWVTTGTGRYQLTVPQSVDLPLNTPYRLQINTTTKLISAVTYTDAMVEGNLILGFVTASSTGLKTIDFAFAVNGVVQDAIVLARQYVNDTGYGRVKPTTDSNINFNSVNSVLEFKNTIIVNTGTLNYQITTPQNIALSTDGTYRIEINTANRALRAVAYTADRVEGYVVLGFVKKTGAVLESTDFGKFTTNGVYVDTSFKDTQRADIQTTGMTVDMTARTVTLGAGSWAYTTTGKLAVNTTAFAYPATDGLYVVLLNKSTSNLEFYGFSGYLSLLSAGTHYYVFMLDTSKGITYGFTGKLIVTGGASTTPPAKTNYSLAFTTASNLNFDFINNKIVISANIWIQYNGSRIQIAPQEIALDPARNKYYTYTLVVNPNNSTISVVSTVFPYSIPKDSFLIGAYIEPDLLFYGLDHFSVNGEPFQKESVVRPAFGWDVNNTVDVNVTDSFTPADTPQIGSLRTNIVYPWWDALVTAYPDYVTRTLLGNDASNTLPIYQYRFKPKLPNPQQVAATAKLPKTMMICNHNEGMNMVAMHILMREICANWQNSESLTSLRHGMEFVVIPIGNPWGLDNGQRKNSNQIDINRQFPVGWGNFGEDITNPAYPGTAPLSENEAVVQYNSMVAEKPDIFVDVHSFGPWRENGKSAWIALLNEKTMSAATSAATKIYAQYKKKYSWLVDIDSLVDFSDEKILGGGTASKTGEALGAIGGTFETAWNLKNEPTGLTGHPSAVNFSTDLLATCILQCMGVLLSSK